MTSGSTTTTKSNVKKVKKAHVLTAKREAGKVPLAVSARLSAMAETYFESELAELEHVFDCTSTIDREAKNYEYQYAARAKAKTAGMGLMVSMAKMMATAINGLNRNTKNESALAADLVKNVRSRMADRGFASRDLAEDIAEAEAGDE